MCRRWFSRDDERQAAERAAQAQEEVARLARQQALDTRAAEQAERAAAKAEDILASVEAKDRERSRGVKKTGGGTVATRGGTGRRSLLAANQTGQMGFLGRFA